MKQSILSLIICATMLLSCGDRGTSLLGQLDITLDVNPNVGILITGDHLDATLTGEQRILGIGSSRVFETTDRFNSFGVSDSVENDLSHVAYLKDNAIVCYQVPNYSNFFVDHITLYRTSNKGVTWQQKTIPDLGSDEYRSIQFMNENQGFMLVYDWAYSYPGFAGYHIAKVYSIDFDAGSAVLVGQAADGYQPVTMQFLDPNNGYILSRSIIQDNDAMNTWITRTTNGGVTWSTPTPVDLNIRLSYVEVIDQNKLAVFENTVAHYSADGGMSWQEIETDDYVVDMSFVNASTGYSVNQGGTISKSTDGGLSWNTAGEILDADRYLYARHFSKVQFFNEQVGIVCGNKQIYLTEDGGQSWDILIYPFTYVTGE